VTVNATIAEALKDFINQAPGGTFSQDFRAKRVYVPAIDPDKLGANLSVLVVARPDTRQLADRGGRHIRDVRIDIGVQKRLSAGLDPFTEEANAEIDALATLAEEVADYARPGVELGAATIVATVVDPNYIWEHLATRSVFTSVIAVTVKTVA
jgi:hypothetical protein